MDILASGTTALLTADDSDKKPGIVGTHPIPQPPSKPLIGNLLDIDPNTGLESFVRLIQRYGEIIQLDIVGNRRMFVGSQRLVHELSDQTRFEKKVVGALEQVRHLAGDGLFTAHQQEPSWEVAHRILIPAFGPLSIREMYPGMVDIADQLIKKWQRFGDAKIDVVSDFTKLTLDSELSLPRYDATFYSEDPPPFVEAMARSLKHSGLRIRRLPGTSMFYRSADRQYDADIKLQHLIADEVVQKRIEHPSDDDDLLNKMLKGKDPKTGLGLTPENIRYQLVTFLIAGHETTSGMLSFLFYWLLKTPRAYQAIRSEVDAVCGSEPVKVEHLQKLKYIDASLKEALRLHATAPGWTVAPIKDELLLGGKYMVKQGQPMMVVLDSLHRDPAVWGEDAEEFRPERMLDGKFEALPPDSWKPFGNGVRACIGRPFAWQEALMVVAKIKTTLTIKPAEFYLHATLRKDMLIDPTAAGSPNSGRKASLNQEHVGGAQTDSAADDGRTKVYIYYGSNSGTCKALAHHLLDSTNVHACKGEIAVLDKIANGDLPKDGPVIIVTASYEGNPTDDAGYFVEYIKTAKANALSGVNYAVFGCGHPDWASTFMAVPSYIDNRLSELGATRLLDRGEGDASRADLFDEFDEWEDQLWVQLKGTYTNVAASNADVQQQQRLQAEVNSTQRREVLRYEFLQSVKVISNEVISKGDVEMKRHIVLELPEDASYRAGDYLGLLPTTPLPVVTRALVRLNLHADDTITLKGTSGGGTLPIGTPINALCLFSEYFELEQPATIKQIKSLAERLTDESVNSALERYTQAEVYESEIFQKRISVLALLEDFPQLPISVAEYVEMLPSIKMRQYSISSSPLDIPNRVTLTFSVLDAPHVSGRGARYYGTATHFLSGLVPGARIHAAVRPSNEGFHPPADPMIPMIMGCAGSGIAPFRSFIQERALQKASGRKVGPALLFYGCHSPNTDLLYDEEMAEWQRQGVVSVRHAFSRATGESEGIESGMTEQKLRLCSKRALGFTFVAALRWRKACNPLRWKFSQK
ncbi:hypothetical protein QFC22_005857 [Naganishia vaughanmartiniae]|uniref:Uncharacterized protein n=1 Tax=Naganishia vaughanmartiniae TaxID=1424756 RepID=A0ACC2WQY7_9TREE|nr:hypothetical protein QFC22_005857 [Naganishia vaughanmartiniae]